MKFRLQRQNERKVSPRNNHECKLFLDELSDELSYKANTLKP